MAWEVLEKSDHYIERRVSGVDSAREARARRVKRGELTIPKRFSTLRVSMVCNVGISTRSSECSGLKGMIV
jgi:hypothetical protein